MCKDVSMTLRVAASVVLYNSDKQVLLNIDTCADQVSVVYVLDNSEVADEELVSLLKAKPKVRYYWMSGNKGIAAALNKAAQLAIDAGYTYLLMMDDDSQLAENTVMGMLDYITQHESFEWIGSVTAQSDPNVHDNSAQSVWYAITSGSLMNLKAYQQCGSFMEELFIDGVDHEYCYRLKKFGYNVVILNHIFMTHHMGISQELKLFKKVFYKWSSHTPIRSYYLVRNFLYILSMYSVLLPVRVKWKVYYGVIKACLLDLSLAEDKLLRLQYIRKAISDFRNNKLGKLS